MGFLTNKITYNSLPPEKDDILWRCSMKNYSGADVSVEMEWFDVIKRTPCGAWITYYGDMNTKRFVNLKRRKQFASETPEEAFRQFTRRKLNELKIYRARIRDIEKALTFTFQPKETHK